MLPLVLVDIIQSPSLLFIGSLIFCLIYNGWKTSYWYRNGIPGPKSIPFVGNALDILLKPSFETEYEYVKRYGKIVGIYHGCQPNLIIADPDLIRIITVKEFNCFPESFHTPYKSPIERKFLTVLYGTEWKRIRSLLTPTFTTGKLRKVFDLIQSCMLDCLCNLDQSKLQSAENQSFIDLKTFWGRYNMDVTVKCFFGVDLQVYSQPSIAKRALYHFERVFSSNALAATINMIAPEWFSRLTRQSIFSVDNLKYLDNLTQAVIKTRKKQIADGNSQFNDFLQLLLESEVTSNGMSTDEQNNNDIVEQRLTTDEIVSSAVIFLIAGYETTSTLLSWTCYELTHNPEVQDKLFAEIDALSELNYETIGDCVYLEAVINETLRLHPPVIQLPRVAHCDYKLPGKGSAVLPKGSKVFISVYALHHNPDYFPEPSAYRPERFLPENRATIKPFTFLPFGSGPRLCIGMRFALLNAKLALALFLKQYKLINNCHTTQNIEYIFQSGVLAAKNLNVGIEKR